MKLFITICMFALVCAGYAQSVFVVQNDDTPSAHPTLAAALAAAVDGDYIYLPGGSFNVGDVVIDKRVHLVGAGHYPDSTMATGRTVLEGDIYLITGADGTSIEGIYIWGSGQIQIGQNETNADAKNISIKRSSFVSIQFSSSISINYGAENIFIKDCRIRGSGTASSSRINGANTQGIVIETSIISNRLRYFDGGAVFRNNIFLNMGESLASNNVLVDVNNCDFINNIFRATTHFASSSSMNNFFNNVFSMSSCSGGWCFDCVFDAIYEDLFEDVPDGGFDYYYNYHLTETSLAKGAGVDGTDCGIYGGDNPFKEGAVPFNPHIQTKSIPLNTDNQGKLNIEIKVGAQDH